jgi:hypothetical protein
MAVAVSGAIIFISFILKLQVRLYLVYAYVFLYRTRYIGAISTDDRTIRISAHKQMTVSNPAV